MKKFLTILVCIIWILMMAYLLFFGSDAPFKIPLHFVIDHTKVIPVPQDEMAAYNIYALDLSDFQEGSLIDYILSLCTWEISEKSSNGQMVEKYTSNQLEGHLPLLDSFQDAITYTGSSISIQYNSIDGCTVLLHYDQNGLALMNVYDKLKDELYIQKDGAGELHTNFSKGRTEYWFN